MTNRLSNKAMLVSLTISGWAARGSDKEVTDAVLDSHDAQRDSGQFTKKLLDQSALKPIHSITNKARAYHNRLTRPWLDGGTRIIPSILVSEYTKGIQAFKDKHAEAVTTLGQEYPAHKALAKKKLGKLYKESEYPTVEVLMESYQLKHLFLPFPSAKDFRDELDVADMQEIKHDLEKRLEDVVNMAMAKLGKEIAEVVGHMANKLAEFKPANTKTGTKAKGAFRKSLVENVKELAELLPAFNLNDDPKLTAITKRIKKELLITDAGTLREDETVRKKVAKSADEILKEVSAFIA